MIGQTPRIDDLSILRISDTISKAVNIEDLFRQCKKLTSYKLGVYHHMPAIGTHDFNKLNRYWSRGLEKKTLDYLSDKSGKPDPAMEFIFRKSRPYWMSELLEEDEFKDGRNRHRVNLALTHIGDGILAPLYGPYHRRGYIFLGFENQRDYFDKIFIWQIHAILQSIHIRYCVMLEALKTRVNLTKRESEVLELITFGKTNPEIGVILGISSNTVSGHVKRIFLKFNAKDRVTVALKAQGSSFTEFGVKHMTENIHRDAI